MSDQLLKRIEINPNIMGGKPVIKGTRVTVEAILKRLAEGLDVEDVLKDYPYLTKDDIKAAIAYAAKVLEDEVIIPVSP
ncbi:MAG: DUF433 domain-containing protein [Candidatus Asgardarchaeia archaeon]